MSRVELPFCDSGALACNRVVPLRDAHLAPMGIDDDATVAPSVAKPEPVIPEVVFRCGATGDKGGREKKRLVVLF